MVTKKDFDQIVEEFREEAHKRLYGSYLNNDKLLPFLFVHNKNVFDVMLRGECEVLLKSIPDLIAHDIEFYGYNSYLMWKTKIFGVGFVDCRTLRDVANYLPNGLNPEGEIKRNISAALPFDLERAKSGDTIEVQTRDDVWTDVTHIIFFEDYVCVACENGGKFKILEESYSYYLRMKYPPRKIKHGGE